jgi:hypothetical protein
MRIRSIPRIAAIFITLLIGGCSGQPQHSEPPPPQGAAPAHRLLDRFCFDDCMDSQAGQDFCEDRCTY